MGSITLPYAHTRKVTFAFDYLLGRHDVGRRRIVLRNGMDQLSLENTAFPRVTSGIGTSHSLPRHWPVCEENTNIL